LKGIKIYEKFSFEVFLGARVLKWAGAVGMENYLTTVGKKSLLFLLVYQTNSLKLTQPL